MNEKLVLLWLLSGALYILLIEGIFFGLLSFITDGRIRSPVFKIRDEHLRLLIILLILLGPLLISLIMLGAVQVAVYWKISLTVIGVVTAIVVILLSVRYLVRRFFPC